ncbi:hypothetical protein RFM98_10870 [Mesorhizobium sp. VK9D]|uniref:hypothetical protein n=1 Tax=Mesorhizobium australafricanum TaxID=3072311 RepID=UPI002A23B9ED|nr:hypothetical protein [Mesorhizobium sp. VK9D]MDX8453260.1 hypothetical protein [Mesorhizobium sp. VK9D]
MAQHKTTFGGVDIPRCLAGATIAVNRLVAAETEPRIRLLLDHTLFRYPLKPAESGSPFRGNGEPLIRLPQPSVWNCLHSA